jgi:hypothetical protein
VLGLEGRQAFNSLSRDHSNLVADIINLLQTPTFQLPLSGSPTSRSRT